MTRTAQPRWTRLALHGGTFGAVAGLLFAAFYLDAGWAEAVVILWFLLGAAPAGVAAGAAAALQMLALRNAGDKLSRLLAWPAGAALGGLIFFGFSWATLGGPLQALLAASIWALGWLFFPAGRSPV